MSATRVSRYARNEIKTIVIPFSIRTQLHDFLLYMQRDRERERELLLENERTRK